MAALFQSLVAGSFCWFVASSLWIYPHSLSYFNESIGGPLNGPKHLLGSNVDWGQDLFCLLKCLQRDRPGKRLYLAYHGGFDVADIGMSACLPIPSPSRIVISKVAPKNETTTDYVDGAIVVSVQLFLDCRYVARDGSGHSKYDLSKEIMDSLRQHRQNWFPICGYSVLISRYSDSTRLLNE
jgi:hypothetical protein